MPRRPCGKRGATLGELLVVLAIIVVLFIMLWPVIVPSRTTFHGPTCKSNLKQIGTALLMYSQDYDDRLPPYASGSMASPTTLPALIHPYIKNGSVWHCPTDKDLTADYDGTPGDTHVDYGYNWLALSPNGRGVLNKEVTKPAETVVFVDTGSYLAVPAGLAGGWGGSAPAARHTGMVNVGWMDGHVKAMKPEVLDETPATEDGQPLGVGIDGYRYWNLK